MPETQTVAANPRRILVVDDERLIAVTLTAILQQQGFIAAAAFSGEEAVEKAQDFRPDFLVADVVMPGMDGVEAAARIRSSFPDCKVLFISGNARLEDVQQRAQASGFQCELAVKPVPPAELVNRIKELLEPLRPGGGVILNVDDSEVHRQLVTELLKRAGFKVEEASTGQEAVAAATASHPDVIVLDVNLPDFSGFDVFQRLKSQPQTAQIPVVFLTGTAADEESRGRGMQLGAADYLTYPVNPDTFCALVLRLATRHMAASR
jgi:CheY-like chemotaxis protein